jgi:hypothetical protein
MHGLPPTPKPNLGVHGVASGNGEREGEVGLVCLFLVGSEEWGSGGAGSWLVDSPNIFS